MSFPYATTWAPASHWPAALQQSVTQPMAPTYSPTAVQAPIHHTLQVVPVAHGPADVFALAPSYPASNMPAMWSRLHPYIAQSPTLGQQLAQLAQSGWTVEWNRQQGSSCELERRHLNIDVAVPELVLMQVLAHETRHAFDPSVYMQSYANDSDFAAAKMRNEATATLNHMRVRSEIHQGCGIDIGWAQPDPLYYQNALTFRQWHGSDERLLQHIQRLMAWEVTSVHQRPYWEVYVNYWRVSRGLPPVSLQPGTAENQRMQAWSALDNEMSGR